ncbi:hypothetical protein ElyMa_006973100 [Elysia marginata]|uniref:Uncharacterized protein n=1 Tax=Elysia marginata TaxID=1093978 RepID=A0AAV4JLT9_9GAST|nr:hypothetical protein ElyMa_006973100 [Elysia marginata]
MSKAAELCRKAKVDYPFKNGPAGESGYRGFMRRHPELSHRTSSKLYTNRGKTLAREVVAGYFRDLGALTDGIMTKQILNMEESGFQSEPDKGYLQEGHQGTWLHGA